MEPFFEQHPWLFIVVTVVTIEAWNTLKTTALSLLRRRSASKVHTWPTN